MPVTRIQWKEHLTEDSLAIQNKAVILSNTAQREKIYI